MCKILNKREKENKVFSGIIFTKKDDPQFFVDALRWVCGAAGTDKTRLFFTGVYFTRNVSGNLRLVAADGRRMHVLDDIKNRLEKYVARKYGVGFPNTILEFRSTAQEVAFTRLIDAHYPDYTKVIPNNDREKFSIKLDKTNANAEALYLLYRAKCLINPKYLDTMNIVSTEWNVSINDPCKGTEFNHYTDFFNMYAVIMPLQNDLEKPEVETKQAIEKREVETKEESPQERLAKYVPNAQRMAIERKKAEAEFGTRAIVIDSTKIAETRNIDITDVPTQSVPAEDESDLDTFDGDTYEIETPYSTLIEAPPSDDEVETVDQPPTNERLESVQKTVESLKKTASRQKNEKVRNTMNAMLAGISPETIESFIYTTDLAMNKDSPCYNWSDRNKLICFLVGTTDARGYQQWKEAGRKVKKGAKAFYILVPIVHKNDDADKEDQEDQEDRVFFRAAPVFRIEDTELLDQAEDQAA